MAAAAPFGVTAQEIEAGRTSPPTVRCRVAIAVYRGFQTLPLDLSSRLQTRFAHRATTGA